SRPPRVMTTTPTALRTTLRTAHRLALRLASQTAIRKRTDAAVSAADRAAGHMRLATATARAQLGLAAPEIAVEVHITGGIPSLALVGMVGTAVRESRDRVRAAIQQAGLEFPRGKIAVNLAPADLPKAGSRFDLAIAVGILAASGQVPAASLGNHE